MSSRLHILLQIMNKLLGIAGALMGTQVMLKNRAAQWLRWDTARLLAAVLACVNFMPILFNSPQNSRQAFHFG